MRFEKRKLIQLQSYAKMENITWIQYEKWPESFSVCLPNKNSLCYESQFCQNHGICQGEHGTRIIYVCEFVLQVGGSGGEESASGTFLSQLRV